METGCYVVASVPLGVLPNEPLYWHLDTFPDRRAAERAKSSQGTVLEAFDKAWLFTIAPKDWRTAGGAEHTAQVGPLVIKAGVSYTATYLEAVMFPGATSSVHYHPGPEALFPLTGEECMETRDEKLVGSPSQPSIVVPGYVPHKLTITGKHKRTSLGLIVHPSSDGITFQTHQHEWTPKGLCNED